MSTLPRLLASRAGTTPHAVAMRHKDRGIWQEVTWATYFERIKHFSLGLRSLGLEPGDKVAIIGDNRPEWYIAELATHAAGAASVGLFQDAVAHEIRPILAHSDARMVVVEDQEQVDKVLELLPDLPQVEYVIYWDPKGLRHYAHASLRDFHEVEDLGMAFEANHAHAFETRLDEGSPDDLAILSYTSGSTGEAKGAMLSHSSLVAAVRNLTRIDPIQPGDDYLSFLPCGWIAEQALGITASIVTGLVVNFPEEPETVQHDMREIGPRVILAAPRIWENLVSQVTVKMQDADWLKRRIYHWAMHASAGGPQRWLAERLVFAPLRDQLGLGRLRRAYTGGAALGPDAFAFFRHIGVNLKQVYGQTEIGGLSVAHRDGDIDPETVGMPIANTEVRISDSGEIVSRSAGLFMGYYKNPVATDAALRDGWLHSGDAGFFNSKGELVVVDRVKDVILLADGSRFAPQYIENKLKFSPYLKEAVAVGHEQPYVAALLNIDLANVGKWAEDAGIAYTTYTDLAQKPEVYALIGAEVRRANAGLPAPARVERFVLLHKELDADDDEVTRTRKIRRRVIAERYANIISALYDPSVDAVHVSTEVQYQDRRRARIESRLHLCTPGELHGLPDAA